MQCAMGIMKTTAIQAMVGAALLAACAGQDGQDPAGTSESVSSTTSSVDEAPSSTGEASSVYVMLEAARDRCDQRSSCMLAWAREPNTDRPPRLVWLDERALDRDTLDQMAGASDDQLVLRGTFGEERTGPEHADRARTFTAVEAWRAMPDIAAQPGAAYVLVDTVGPVHVAAWVDTSRRQAIGWLSVTAASAALVDGGWLSSRVFSHQAIVAGTFDGMTLEASQVYVHLPDAPGPCPDLTMVCPGNLITTYERDDNRCLVPTACVRPGICPMYLPACETGYDRAAWPTTPNGCSAFACDPAFVDAP